MTCRARGLCCALAVVTLLLNFSTAARAAADRGFATVGGNVKPTTDVDMGAFTNPHMSVVVVLAPRDAAGLSSLLANLYDTNNKNQHWLAKGEFTPALPRTRRGPPQLPTICERADWTWSRLRLRSCCASARRAACWKRTFRTALHTYRNRNRITYFSNASEIQFPEGLAPAVLGVVGLSNTVRLQSQTVHRANRTTPSVPSCETPYVTTAQLFNAVNNGVGFPYGYGGGPGCNGLTPSQDNAIYGAPELGASGEGSGVNLAVFELSAYQQSDIATWARYFYGPGFRPPLTDINVDGGPLNPVCPTGDQCPANYNGYAGDIEVVADIEMQLAIAPHARQLLVYNAPNDFTGQTELDEYTKIANDDIADVISSSWAVCENDAGRSICSGRKPDL